MSERGTYLVRQLKSRFFIQRVVEVVLWAFAIAIITFSATELFAVQNRGAVAGVAFVVTASTLYLALRLHKLSDRTIVQYLNRRYPELQESADLIVKDENTLSRLELIQLSNTVTRIESLAPTIKLPHNIGKAVVGFAGAVLILVLMSALDFRTSTTGSTPVRIIEHELEQAQTPAPPEIKEFTIRISPPKYTGQNISTAKGFDLKILEGATIEWNLRFTSVIRTAWLKFAGKDSISLNSSNGRFVTKKTFVTSSIYQIIWKDEQGEKASSDYYQVEVIQDKSPEISFTDLRQSIELTTSDKPTIELRAKISDDYAVTDAYIIATVAKGSGESVKFREEKLPFTRPSTIAGQRLSAERVIDIKRLGLEPGDELYFYGEVFDNKHPKRNRSRTETFFITLLDTAAQQSVVDAGLGVDLMPEYFRSQRQIIMDTEKLLRNKKSVSKKEFNFLSNELGYDQKVLRLKYGEFLGEEFESELASSDELGEAQVETVIEEAKEGEEDMAEKFGHAHDKDNDHNLVEDKKPGHSHNDEPKDPEAKENPLEAFVHAHDDAEEATFFLQSVRTKLKAALTEMWDAELYLRLYEPEKSLPFQYKALKLLKEVSNDSRIYVHKTGFDPPPIKEEKRLSGDLTEIKNLTRNAALSEELRYPSIGSALKAIDKLLQQERILVSPAEKEILLNAGQELTPLAMQKPAHFLPALSLIKNIDQNQIQPRDIKTSLVQLQKILYSALPSELKQANSSTGSASALDQSFIDNLQKLKND